MLWRVVEFIKENSVAAVPVKWIKKSGNTVVCYWPHRNANVMRKKNLPIEGKHGKYYECKILVDGKLFRSFEAAEKAEKQLTAAPAEAHKKTGKSSEIKNLPAVVVQTNETQETRIETYAICQRQTKKNISDEMGNTHKSNTSANVVPKAVTASSNSIDTNHTGGSCQQISSATTGQKFWKKKIVDNYILVDSDNITIDSMSDPSSPPTDMECTTSDAELCNSLLYDIFCDHPMTTDEEPVIAKPAITYFVMAEPMITEPAITKPAITEPAITKPAITEQGITDTAITDTVINQSVIHITKQPKITECVRQENRTEDYFCDNVNAVNANSIPSTASVSDAEAVVSSPLTASVIFASSMPSHAILPEQPIIFQQTHSLSHDYADSSIFTGQSLFSIESVTNHQPSIDQINDDSLLNIGDYLEFPFTGMDMELDVGNLFDITEDIGIEAGQDAANDMVNENDIDIEHQSGETAISKTFKEMGSSTSDDVASEMIQINHNSSIDGAVQSDSASLSGEKSSIPVPGHSEQRQDNVDFHIHHLGSNNYRDSQSYLYTKNNCRGSILYLRCKNSVKHNCPSRVTVRDNNFVEASMTIAHNHPPDQRLLDNQIFDKKLRENVRSDPFLSPRQIYLNTKTQLKDIIDSTNIPPLKKKEALIYRYQRKYIPPLPSTIEEFEKYIMDPKYKQFFTCDHRNLPYYRGIWTSKRGEKNLVFISDTILKVINTMNNISFFMDGTYKALPHHIPFRQLYVINVTYDDQCYPLAYIFMEKKTFSSYDTIFQNLKFLMPSVEVVKLMTDYEAATRKALRKHYPNARIAGCFFHYVQAIVKGSKKFGLRRDEMFREPIKKICALALLPNEYVLAGFESIDTPLRTIGSERWERFRKYWLKQWAPANISVHSLVDRSNNFSESNNKSLNLLLKRTHPNIWNLIMNLKLLETDKSDQIYRAVRGQMITTQRTKDMVRLNEKIAQATERFAEDRNVSAFLRRVTFEENLELFVKDQVNIMDNDDNVDVDDEIDDEVIPNHYSRESDFRRNHPRQATNQNNDL